MSHVKPKSKPMGPDRHLSIPRRVRDRVPRGCPCIPTNKRSFSGRQIKIAVKTGKHRFGSLIGGMIYSIFEWRKRFLKMSQPLIARQER